MTIKQIEEINTLIKRRDIIIGYIKEMEDVYAVDFHKPGPADKTIRFMEFTSSNFNSKLSTGAVKAAREALLDYLMRKGEEVLVRLEELGLELEEK